MKKNILFVFICLIICLLLFHPKKSFSANLYVNDNDTTGDIYTTAVGDDTTGLGTSDTPYLTITKALANASSGDTIYIDAGIYSETVVIDTNNISLIGADSVSTIIDPPGDSTIATLYGIYANARTNQTIKNLRITECYYGIYLNNVATSIIEDVTVDWCGGGSGAGIYLYSSDPNTIQNSYAYKNYFGFYLYSSSNNTLANNTAQNNGYGFYLSLSSNNNTLANNTSQNNTSNGFYLQSSSNNTLTNNTAQNNTNIGFYLISSNNALTNNTSQNNGDYGFYVNNSSNNYFVQNTADLNQMYGFFITGTSSVDTFVKNNIKTSPANPDSGVFSDIIDTSFDFTRNYWNTTNQDSIYAMIAGAGADSIIWRPYRLGAVDTAAGADTIAPETTVILSADTSFGGVVISWQPVTSNEDNSSLIDLAGYRIYRTQDSTPVDLQPLYASVSSSETQYIDTNTASNQIYYYYVTAYDAKSPLENESFYSDKIMAIAGPPKIDMSIDTVTINAPTGTGYAGSATDTVPGAKIIYEITINNSGQVDAKNLNLKIYIPDNTQYDTTNCDIYFDTGSGYVVQTESITGDDYADWNVSELNKVSFNIGSLPSFTIYRAKVEFVIQ